MYLFASLGLIGGADEREGRVQLTRRVTAKGTSEEVEEEEEEKKGASSLACLEASAAFCFASSRSLTSIPV